MKCFKCGKSTGHIICDLCKNDNGAEVCLLCPDEEFFILPDHMGIKYFDQAVFSSNGAELVKISDNYSQTTLDALKNSSFKRIVIEGEGGIGKSTLLKRIKDQNDELNIYAICKLSLTALTNVNIRSDIPQKFEKISRIYSFIKNHIDDADKVIAAIKNNANMLFLLDGFNELYTRPAGLQQIISELQHLMKLVTDSTVIITSRPVGNNNKSIFNAIGTGFEICSLSGVDEKTYKEFLASPAAQGMSEGILKLAKIPLYYDVIANSNGKSLNTKYDLVEEIYRRRFSQTDKCNEAFYAFYVLAPFVAKLASISSDNCVTRSQIENTLKKVLQIELSLFYEYAQDLCQIPLTSCIDSTLVIDIFLNSGPVFERQRGRYAFFHDEITAYLLAYKACSDMYALKKGCEEGYDYNDIADINVDVNLQSDAMAMLKEKLNITTAGAEAVISEMFGFLKSKLVTPNSIKYCHCAYLMGDYMYLGVNTPTYIHNAIEPFIRKISREIENDNFDNVVASLDQTEAHFIKSCVLQIYSKSIEHFRRNDNFSMGREYIDVALKIGKIESSELDNSIGKLGLAMHRNHIVLGTNEANVDYADIFKESIKKLETAADREFNLSANLLAMIYSVPAPYLIKSTDTAVEFDHVKAFWLNYKIVFSKKNTDYTAREIEYALRQALGLLIKGYVRLKNDIVVDFPQSIFEGDIEISDHNTLNLNKPTIELCRYLLSFAVGTTQATFNYFRAIVAFYDEKFELCKEYLRNENDAFLRDIFLHYKFNDQSINVEEIFKKIIPQLSDDKRNFPDACHQIYWYYDARSLSLMCSPDKLSWLKNIERDFKLEQQTILNMLEDIRCKGEIYYGK